MLFLYGFDHWWEWVWCVDYFFCCCWGRDYLFLKISFQLVLIYSCLSTWNSEKELCTWTRRVRFEFFHYLSDLWPFIFLIYKMEMIIATYMHGVVVKNKLINVPKHFMNVMYYRTHYPYPWNKIFRNERLTNKSWSWVLVSPFLAEIFRS